MAKGDEDVRERLQRTALELFREHGYDRTTAADIAARAGVTERTFFRYFPDKREVLFGGEAILQDLLTTAIAGAPERLGPLEALFAAFRSVAPLLEGNRPFSEPRQAVISSTPALRERELAKLAALTDALAASLRARRVGDLPAALAAQTGMAAFAHATISWLEEPQPALVERLDDALRELRALLA